jgi:hypothetical protein
MAVGTWVGNQCGMVFTPENSTAIGWIKDGEICAGVWYEDYNKVSVMCHIALTRQMTPEYLNIIFDYPFVQLGVNKIIVPVISDNEASVKFVKNLGFYQENAGLKNASVFFMFYLYTDGISFFLTTNGPPRYRERPEGTWRLSMYFSGLPRRFAPRNDGKANTNF